VNGPLQPFQIQAFTYLGVKMTDVIQLEYPRAYRVQELLYPRTASHLCTPHLAFQPAIVDWLRDKFKRLRSPGGGRRKLFISRAGGLQSHARRVLNEDEITDLAREQGFEIVRCEELSFETQVTMFSEASIIVGAHGAGLINLVFAHRSAKIVEMIGPRFDRPWLQPDQQGWSGFSSQIYMKLSSLLGQNFVRLVGKSDCKVPVHMNHLPFETYIIEPAQFTAAIRQ
jgi:capsular polysaccharide biosynthesis protein